MRPSQLTRCEVLWQHLRRQLTTQTEGMCYGLALADSTEDSNKAAMAACSRGLSSTSGMQPVPLHAHESIFAWARSTSTSVPTHTCSLTSNSINRPSASACTPSYAHRWVGPTTLPSQPSQRGFSTATGRSFAHHHELVEHLVASGQCSKEVGELMLQVDRMHFCHTWTSVSSATSYKDAGVPIGQGHNISAPSMHAICLELMHSHLYPGAYTLDIGSGSGYLLACMGLAVGKQGLAIGVEKQKRLADLTHWNLTTCYSQLMDANMLGNTEILCGDALEEDALEDLPDFDLIHVGGSCEEIPEQFIRKLKPGGRMVIPIGPPTMGLQVLTAVDKGNDCSLTVREDRTVKMMPLIPPFFVPESSTV